MFTRFRVSSPDEYLVRTGLGIKNLQLSKSCFVWPFQKVTRVNLNPRTYEFSLHNMSKEKVEFNLPVVFTIGPTSPTTDPEGFMEYAQKLNSLKPSEIEAIVKGVIEGETRGFTARMTVEELFNSKETFKAEVQTKIQEDLKTLGLTILNANIKEMSDYDTKNQYFAYRKQRAVETANYESQVEVARERKRGDIGMKEQEKETRINVAALEADATLSENERFAELAFSNATLDEARAEARRRSEIANIEATMAALLRQTEIQKDVEIRRQGQNLEQLRADQLSGTRVEAEQLRAQAEGKSDYMRKIADAELYEVEQRAKGIEKTLVAQSIGLGAIIDACQGDQATARFYLALKDELYEKLAVHQAAAVQGLNPNISVWNTGGDSGKEATPILKLVQSFAPMLDGLHKHTDFKIPSQFLKQTEQPKE